jgi:hypothetical protein
MMGRVLVAALALAVLAPPVASAELVGEFDAAVRGIKKYGAYTVVASARVYETSGEPAPQLASAIVHFPRGAALRREFLVDRFFCDGETLQRNPDPRLCRHALFASGELLVDARPAISDPVPADIHLFLTSGRERGATAGVVVLVKSNQRSHVYNYEVLRGYLFNESSDRRFGYRLELPTALKPLLPEVTLSLIEMQLKVRGLKRERQVRRCVRRTRGARGRCLERRSSARKVFWIKTPRCPPTRRINFGADYAFQGARPLRKRRKVSCRRFLRRPSVHRRGRIPGAPDQRGR